MNRLRDIWPHEAVDFSPWIAEHLDFWSDMRTKLIAAKVYPVLPPPSNSGGFSIPFGVPGVTLSLRHNSSAGSVSVFLYIPANLVDRFFPALLSRKNEIDTKIGQPLHWEQNPSTKGRTISLTRPVTLTDEVQRQHALDWLTESAVSFRTVLLPIFNES